MTNVTLKLLGGEASDLADFLERRLTCVCDDRLESLVSGSALMQAIVNLHFVLAAFERSVLNLAHTVIVQPEFVQDGSISAPVAARRSIEIYRLIAGSSGDGKPCPTRSRLARQQLARAFMKHVPVSMGLAGVTIEPTDQAIKQAHLIEQTLSPGRAMSEQEFFQALGFCLAWTNFCNAQFRSLNRFLRGNTQTVVSDLESKVVKTFYGAATAFTWIGNTIEASEQNFAGIAKSLVLLFDYYVGNTEPDILCYWVMTGIKNVDAFHADCMTA